MTRRQTRWFVVALVLVLMGASLLGAMVVADAPWSLEDKLKVWVVLVCWELVVAVGAVLLVRRLAARRGGHRR